MYFCNIDFMYMVDYVDYIEKQDNVVIKDTKKL